MVSPALTTGVSVVLVIPTSGQLIVTRTVPEPSESALLLLTLAELTTPGDSRGLVGLDSA